MKEMTETLTEEQMNQQAEDLQRQLAGLVSLHGWSNVLNGLAHIANLVADDQNATGNTDDALDLAYVAGDMNRAASNLQSRRMGA